MSGCCGFACILALEEQCGELGAACVLQSRPPPAPTPWAPGLLRGSFGAVSSPSGRLERQFPG